MVHNWYFKHFWILLIIVWYKIHQWLYHHMILTVSIFTKLQFILEKKSHGLKEQSVLENFFVIDQLHTDGNFNPFQKIQNWLETLCQVFLKFHNIFTTCFRKLFLTLLRNSFDSRFRNLRYIFKNFFSQRTKKKLRKM